jgi:membrane protease YdiL (CAAX protease family)
MKNRAFSIKIYLAVVLLLSWPFQLAYLILGESVRPLLLISMVMAGVATFICGRYIFNDRFENAGWSWGKPKHYILAFALALFLWAVPSLLEQYLGIYVAQQTSLSAIIPTFLVSFCITLLPAFSEEFSWRGYLLPRLLKRYTPRKAVLMHGFVTWLWHLPVIVAMGLNTPGNQFVSVITIAVISLIPTIMHAVVFAYFWSVSKSLAVSTVYHSAFDEIRDTLQGAVGFGPFVEIWQMATLTLLGIGLLWRIRWLKYEK